MEYWHDGVLWSGITQTDTVGQMTFWENGILYGNIYQAPAAANPFISKVIWFF